MAQRTGQIVEAKDPVDDRLNEILLKGAVHLFELSARTNVDAPQMNLPVQNEWDMQRLRGLAEDADLCDGATNANRC